MIIIEKNRDFTEAEIQAIDSLQSFHYIKLTEFGEAEKEAEKARCEVYDAFFKFEEQELKEIREILPKRKNFKLNDRQVAAWQKKQRGFIRPCFGFSDNKSTRKAFKKTGLFTGKISDITKLHAKMQEASG